MLNLWSSLYVTSIFRGLLLGSKYVTYKQNAVKHRDIYVYRQDLGPWLPYRDSSNQIGTAGQSNRPVALKCLSVTLSVFNSLNQLGYSQTLESYIYPHAVWGGQLFCKQYMRRMVECTPIATILLAHHLLLSSVYPIITYTYPAAGNLPIKLWLLSNSPQSTVDSLWTMELTQWHV